MKTASKRPIARMLGGVAATAIAISSSTAFAQSADETANDDDIITVIGVTKQVENIQKVPSTITVFTGDKLETQGIREVGEVAKFTPGFNIRGSGNNPTAFSLSMRGQIQNDNLATLEPSVGIYMDEMYIARAYGLNVDMLDVSNVQVLKGPQGTLFGRNTSAGAMLISTNDPKFGEFSGVLKGSYGRFNEWNTTGILNVGLGEDFAIRGAVSYGERDNYKRDINSGKKYEGRETLNARVKVAWQPSDNLTVLLSGEWYDGKINGPARQGLFLSLNPLLFAGVLGVAGSQARVAGMQALADAEIAAMKGKPDLLAISPPTATPGADPRGIFNDMKTQTYGAKFTLDTDFGQIKWINGYRQIKGDNLVDLDGTSLPLHFTAGRQNLKQFSTELQLTGASFEDRLKYALGLTYFRESGTDRSRSSTFGSPAWSQFLGDIDNNSFGAYGQVSYKVTDALSLTGGLRYSIDDKGVTTISGTAPNNGDVLSACTPTSVLLATGCIRGRKDTWKNLSYTFGADYQATDDILIFAKHSKGYRSGAQQLRSLTLTDTTPAAPEVVYEQELGIKTQFMDKRVRFNISGYHNRVKGAQRSVILAVGGISQTILENADTETWGAEADLSVTVTDGFTLFANGSLTDPKYLKYNGFVVLGGVLTPNDKKDTNFAGIVKKQFTLGGNYEVDLGAAKLTLNASYAWQGAMKQDGTTVARFAAPTSTPGGSGFSAANAALVDQFLTTRAHGITNARATVAFGPEGNYELALWGRNIFDQRATSYTLFLGGINYLGTSWNEPASYGVTATVKF